MLDTLRLVGSEDVGHDEASVQSLVKKHKNITEELNNYQKVVDALAEQAGQLGEQVCWGGQVLGEQVWVGGGTITGRQRVENSCCNYCL